MSVQVLVSGVLFKAPEQRTSKAGKPFVTAILKAKDGDNSQFWRLVAFSESVQAELTRLTDGDALSVQGSFKAELYNKEPGDTPRLNLSVIVDCVLPLRSPRKKPGDREKRTPPPQASIRAKPAAAFDDAIPF